jgi:hypothetical protein
VVDDDAYEAMASMIFGPRILAQVLRCVAQFSLTDHLAEGARSSRSIAAAARLNEHATHRLLRYCATVGLAEAHADGTYSGTALLATLRSDDSRALRSFAMAQNGLGSGRFSTTWTTPCAPVCPKPRPHWVAVSTTTTHCRNTRRRPPLTELASPA